MAFEAFNLIESQALHISAEQQQRQSTEICKAGDTCFYLCLFLCFLILCFLSPLGEMAGNEEWKLVFQKELVATEIHWGKILVPKVFHNNCKAYLPPKFHATLNSQKGKLDFNADRCILSGLGTFPCFKDSKSVGQAFILMKKNHPSSEVGKTEEEFSIMLQDKLLDIIGTVHDLDPITANPPEQELEFVFKCSLNNTIIKRGRVVLPDNCVKPAKDKKLVREQDYAFEATLKGETQRLTCSAASVRFPSIGDFRDFAWFKENAQKGQQLYVWKHKLEPNRVVIEIVEDPKTDTAPRDDSNDPGHFYDHDD